MEESGAGGPSRGIRWPCSVWGIAFFRRQPRQQEEQPAAAAAAAAAVRKGTVGSGKAGFGSRVDSHRDGVWKWRRVAPGALASVYVGLFQVRRKAFFLLIGFKSNVRQWKGSRGDSHWQGVSVWRRAAPAGRRGAYVGRVQFGVELFF